MERFKRGDCVRTVTLPRQSSRLGYSAFTRKTRVRFPDGELTFCFLLSIRYLMLEQNSFKFCDLAFTLRQILRYQIANKTHRLVLSLAAATFLFLLLLFLLLNSHLAFASQSDILLRIESSLNPLCTESSSIIDSASTRLCTTSLSLLLSKCLRHFCANHTSARNFYLLVASVLKTQFTLSPLFALALTCSIPISLAQLTASSRGTVLLGKSLLFPAIMIGASFGMYFLSSKYQVFTFSNESKSVTSYTRSAPNYIKLVTMSLSSYLKLLDSSFQQEHDISLSQLYPKCLV